jgi:hypothetical protein
MAEIRAAIVRALKKDHPMTVRQVFYRLVSEVAIGKTEAEYLKTVVRLLTIMRRDGEIPWDWIIDNSRTVRKPYTYSDFDAALEHFLKTYRLSAWDNQPARVEVWLEKAALAGVLYQVTYRYDVPLMVSRGYSSVSFLHDGALAIAA